MVGAGTGSLAAVGSAVQGENRLIPGARGRPRWDFEWVVRLALLLRHNSGGGGKRTSCGWQLRTLVHGQR